MRPRLLTSPRATPLNLVLVGDASDLASFVLASMESHGVQTDFHYVEPLFDLLSKAAFGQLKYRRDVKIIKATLPEMLFQLRYSVATHLGVVQGRFFCIEQLPNTITLLGLFFKVAGDDSEATRIRQTEAARRALGKVRNIDIANSNS